MKFVVFTVRGYIDTSLFIIFYPVHTHTQHKCTKNTVKNLVALSVRFEEIKTHARLCKGGRLTSCSCQSRRRQGTRYTTPTTSKPRIEPRCTKECSEILNARKHGLSFSENSQGYRANSRLPGLLLQRRPTSSSAAFCTSVQHVPGNEI